MSSLERERGRTNVLYQVTHSLFIVGVLALPRKARWPSNGVTMTSRNDEDDHNNQLNYPHGLNIDDDNQSIVIAGSESDRSVDWKMGENNGIVIVGDQIEGNQLCSPTDVFIDKETNSPLGNPNFGRK